MEKHILNIYIPEPTWIILRKLKGDGKIKSVNGYVLDLVKQDLKQNEKTSGRN